MIDIHTHRFFTLRISIVSGRCNTDKVERAALQGWDESHSSSTVEIDRKALRFSETFPQAPFRGPSPPWISIRTGSVFFYRQAKRATLWAWAPSSKYYLIVFSRKIASKKIFTKYTILTALSSGFPATVALGSFAHPYSHLTGLVQLQGQVVVRFAHTTCPLR